MEKTSCSPGHTDLASLYMRKSQYNTWSRTTLWRYMLTAALLPAILGQLHAEAAEAAEPWRLGSALQAPKWLTVGGSYMNRFEFLDGQYRVFGSGVTGSSDQILVQRLLFSARADFDVLYVGAELQDSRTSLDDAGTPLGTDDVNALEPLQAYVGMLRKGVLTSDDTLDVRAGRLTIDTGSRRLTGRNRFRNTSNSFTGVLVEWQDMKKRRVQSFLTLPVYRRPVRLAALDDNEARLDSESSDSIYWGVFAAQDGWHDRLNAELYAFGLHDDARREVRPRDLVTVGLRLLATPVPGEWDGEVDAALQAGSVGQPDPARGRLDHRAGFMHAHLARSFARSWTPRLMVQFDYASGDRAPDDDESNRFDTLFGARFDFGPTGIYGLLAHSNLISPGLRLEVRPRQYLSAYAGYRAAWLESETDTFPSGGLRNRDGDFGRFLGHQFDVQIKAELCAGTVRLEAGAVWFEHGRFLQSALAEDGTGRTTYAYAQAILNF